jgi:hypothetical protein
MEFKNTMFEVPIYHYVIGDWDLKKKKLMEIYASLKLTIKDDTVKTDFNQPDRTPYWNEIKNILGYELNAFSQETNQSLRQTGYWFESSSRGMYHEIHNHGAIGYSSVCFVQYHSRIHTPTKFVAPFNHFWSGEQLTFSPDIIGEGSIIFFPSAIHHFTNPNESDHERIILSFNLIPDNMYQKLIT